MPARAGMAAGGRPGPGFWQVLHGGRCLFACGQGSGTPSSYICLQKRIPDRFFQKNLKNFSEEFCNRMQNDFGNRNAGSFFCWEAAEALRERFRAGDLLIDKQQSGQANNEQIIVAILPDVGSNIGPR